MEEENKAAFASELKKQLQTSMEKIITEENDVEQGSESDTIEEAIKSLCVLRDLAMMTRNDRKKQEPDKLVLGGMKKKTSKPPKPPKATATVTASVQQVSDPIEKAMKSLRPLTLKDLTTVTSHHRDKPVVLGRTKKIDKSQQASNTATTTSGEREEWFHLLPDEFKCPLSGSLMVDPVVISSGQTYDKQYIQKWFEDGNQKCPKTDEKLTHTRVVPNNSVKKLILRWFEHNNIPVPTTLSTVDEERTVNAVNQKYLVTLLEKLVSSVSYARGAVKELQTLMKRLSSARALVWDDESGAIPRLLSQLLVGVSGFGEELYENLVSTLLSISIHANNSNKLLQDIPPAISFLVKCLSDKRIETRGQAAATVSELTEVVSNLHMIGNSGAIKPLIELMKEEDPWALNGSVSAILRVSTVPKNGEIAISEGAVAVVVKKITDHILLDDMLRILTVLCHHQTAIDQMVEHGRLRELFRLLNNENVNEEQKEYCVAIVHKICFSDERKKKSVWEEDTRGEIISHIATTGSERAKKLANQITKRLDEDKYMAYRNFYRVYDYTAK